MLDRTPPLARTLSLFVLACVAACGHPATEAECRELFVKSAEVELRAQKLSEPKAIADAVEGARKAPRGAEFEARCKGRRVTSGTLECIRRATSAAELDRCL